MSLVTLYGRKATQFHDGRNVYAAASGVLKVPPSLVARAMRDGFSRTPPADADGDEGVQGIRAPAEQYLGIPAAHPQHDVDAANEAAREKAERVGIERARFAATVPATGVAGGGAQAPDGPPVEARENVVVEANPLLGKITGEDAPSGPKAKLAGGRSR